MVFTNLYTAACSVGAWAACTTACSEGVRKSAQLVLYLVFGKALVWVERNIFTIYN